MNNFIIIILDGVGIGELPDSHLYQDEGSNTLCKHCFKGWRFESSEPSIAWSW